MRIKRYLRQHFLALVDSVQRFRGRDLFSGVYAGNAWNDPESRSGSGSTLHNTATIRAELPGVLGAMGVRSMLDIPCGDFNWMKQVALALNAYVGADVVRQLIARNSERFANASVRFVVLDIMRQKLPQVDLVFCRDCLVHFSDSDVFRAVANIRKSNPQYLLTTTFPQRAQNASITTGQWRPLNLQIAPSNFPPPLRLINERYDGDGGQYADKSLALWRVADLPDPQSAMRHPQVVGDRR